MPLSEKTIAHGSRFRIGLGTLLALIGMAPSPALAQVQPAQEQSAQARLHYIAYSAGLPVIDALADVGIDHSGYQLDLRIHTVGVLTIFVGGHTESIARGTWQGVSADPAAYTVQGHWRGETLLTRIDYTQDRPAIRVLLPDPSRERELVPPALQAHTIDTLSAVAALVHRLNSSGHCDAEARVFDGRRLSQVSVRTGGWQTLPRTDRSSFSGPALRCDFDGELLAGFKFEDDRARAARPRHGSAWLARLAPGGPLLPVRLQFETPIFGQTTLYLQQQ